MAERSPESRLRSLAPANLDEARKRAAVAARVSMSAGRGPAAHGASLRRLSLAGALAALVAALVVALGAGGGSGIKAEVASASDLNALAAESPHLQMVGGWQITDTEVTPEGGATRFRYERDDSRGEEVEIKWYTAAAVDEVGRQLLAEGFEAAGAQPVVTSDALKMRAGEWDSYFTYGTAQVYATPAAGDGTFEAVGVWRQDGLTFALGASVEQLEELERRLERVQFLGPEEWAIAIRPGGGLWLNESSNGTTIKVEEETIEGPDGTVLHQTKSEVRTPEEIEEFGIGAPFPVIYHEGGTVRVEVRAPPLAE